jgi:coenzyme F420 hydrogenase subunit beta
LPTSALLEYQAENEGSQIIEKLGAGLELYSARTKVSEIKNSCQDGGIASTCLYHLFETDEIQLAIGAKVSEDPWRPIPFMMDSIDDVISAAGTKYVNSPNLSLLNDKKLRISKYALVGVPCHMQALLKSKIYDVDIPTFRNLLYRIGIFCMESFPYELGFIEICKLLNVKITDVKKTDINKGKFFIYTQSGEEFSIPIKEINHLARPDCEICYDLTSESADISIGSIGSPSGWNTVIIRTEQGKKLYEELLKKNLIESKKIEEVKPGLELLQKIANSKKNKCKKHIELALSENKRVPNY